MSEPYVVILFPTEDRAVVLDRDYLFITEDKSVWGGITFGEVIETDKDFFAGQLPQWAYDMEELGHLHIALWLRQ